MRTICDAAQGLRQEGQERYLTEEQAALSIVACSRTETAARVLLRLDGR